MNQLGTFSKGASCTSRAASAWGLLHFIRCYLEEAGGKAAPPSPEEQERLEAKMLLEISRFTLASHFFWGLWSILQAKISTIEFGYLEYAQCRFEAYFQQKARGE